MILVYNKVKDERSILMKSVMYGIEIADVNDFGGWVGYEPVKEDIAEILNGHVYLFFQNEYHIRQFAEGRKFVINVKDDSFGKKIDQARILKAIVEVGTPLSMNGYEISAPAYARNVIKPLSRKTKFIEEKEIYCFADKEYTAMKTDFNYITHLMKYTSIEDVNSLIGATSFVNKNLLYHYPHYFLIGLDQVDILDDDYHIA